MRIGKLILPLLSGGGQPLAVQHTAVAKGLLDHFGQFITTRAMCVTRTGKGPGSETTDSAEHVATYEPIAVTTDEDWAVLNTISDNFKAAVAEVNKAEEATQAENYAKSEAGEAAYKVGELSETEAESDRQFP